MDDRLRVEFVAPSSNNGALITAYEIDIGLDGGFDSATLGEPLYTARFVVGRNISAIPSDVPMS